MAVYNNNRADSGIASVEFMPVAKGNLSFVTIADPAKKEEVRQWLTAKDIGQEIVAESVVGGKPVLVTQGDKPKDELMKALSERGEQLAIEVPERKFDAWKWRGTLSNIGQSLNLISGYRKPGGLDVPKLSFAGLNFAASYVNATFGGQKSEDEYQLRYLKENINDLLGKHLPDGMAPPPPEDSRVDVRREPQPRKTFSQQAYDLMKGNSVRVGEIGLRYFGSIALAFPLKNWKGAAAKLQAEGLAEAFQAASNKDRTNFWTGATYLTGKTIGLFSKVPDPYNPAPHTALDTFREKYVFRLSSAIETGAAATLAYGNFRPKKGQPDMIGGAGGAVLVAGLITRQFAAFGTRNVDMDELYAHTTDILANTPREKLPQLIADAAASLTDHFKDQKLDYGKVYTRMMMDLYRYHQIALQAPGVAPAAPVEGAPTRMVNVAAHSPAMDPSPLEAPDSYRMRLQREALKQDAAPHYAQGA